MPNGSATGHCEAGHVAPRLGAHRLRKCQRGLSVSWSAHEVEQPEISGGHAFSCSKACFPQILGGDTVADAPFPSRIPNTASLPLAGQKSGVYPDRPRSTEAIPASPGDAP